VKNSTDTNNIAFYETRRMVVGMAEAMLRAFTRFRGIGRYPDPEKYFGPGGLAEARRLCAAVNRDPAGYYVPDPNASAGNPVILPRQDRPKRVVEDIFFNSPAPSGRKNNDRVQVRLFRHHNTMDLTRVVLFHHPIYQNKWRMWERFLSPLIANIPVAFLVAPNHYGRTEPGDFPGEWTVNSNPFRFFEATRQWCWDQQAATNLLLDRFGLEQSAVVGFSVGAFKSTLLAALGSLDVPLISLASTNRYATGLIKGAIGPPILNAMKQVGIDHGLLEEMTDSMQLERYAPALRGRDVLMIRGLFDMVDPPPSLSRLEEALRPARIVRLPTGHGTLVLHRKTVMDEILLFLAELGIVRS
jgi:pimeloyl-ACP methyl ester carboxylesterase